jgi:hypothetical protein
MDKNIQDIFFSKDNISNLNKKLLESLNFINISMILIFT